MPMAVTAETGLAYIRENPRYNRRGVNVYTTTELLGITGRDNKGQFVTAQYEQPIFMLTLDERIDMYRLCADVYGIVSSRMQRIAGMEWRVYCDEKEDDRTVAALRDAYQIFKEYEGVPDLKYLAIRLKMANFINQRLPDVTPDLSNFQNSLMRWLRRERMIKEDRSTEIQDWLEQPNQGVTMNDFLKMYVNDLMIHGGSAVYKDQLNGVVENFYNLPGGTVIPLVSKYVGGATPFAQVVDGEEVKIYFEDEIAYSKYVPTTARSHGMIPLEALVNKLAESLMFDKRAAEQADGTRPPEKLIVFGDNQPFGAFDGEFKVPMNTNEQIRIETAINEARKEAIRTLSGVGTPLAVDISRSDQFPHHMQRQQQIREYVGLVYQASNMEMNLSGSDDTSGRATSESQERIDRQRGVWPVVYLIQQFFNKKIIPFRFGTGYRFEFSPGVSEAETVELVKKKLDSGAFTLNEIRTVDLGMDPFQGEEYDMPFAKGAAAPGADSLNPMFTQGVEE